MTSRWCHLDVQAPVDARVLEQGQACEHQLIKFTVQQSPARPRLPDYCAALIRDKKIEADPDWSLVKYDLS